ncbi:hypothetical protein F5887DRAFT_1161504 [Amanita rubescens]|nr:hypothetical protein F5887DRAFT_1161504 [Amanita rubescens]
MFRQNGCDAHTIAYAAVQTYFTLSSANEWTVKICGFDLLLGKPDEPWVVEILAWWNRHVGIYREPELQNVSGSDTESDPGPDPIYAIEIQRERRRRELEELEATNNNHEDIPIDPELLQNERRRELEELEAASNNQDVRHVPIDPQLLQNENQPCPPDQPASTSNQDGYDHQPQNAPINGQDQVPDEGGCDTGNQVTPPSSPLTDLDRNRPGARSSASGLRATGAHQKRQAGSDSTGSTQSKKPKAVPVNTVRRSQRRRS